MAPMDPAQAFPRLSQSGLDFIARFLLLDPARRIAAEEVRSSQRKKTHGLLSLSSPYIFIPLIFFFCIVSPPLIAHYTHIRPWFIHIFSSLHYLLIHHYYQSIPGHYLEEPQEHKRICLHRHRMMINEARQVEDFDRPKRIRTGLLFASFLLDYRHLKYLMYAVGFKGI